jgi:hypothetical protein
MNRETILRVETYTGPPGTPPVIAGPDSSGPTDKPEQSIIPVFPETAWRGVFAEYRSAMREATEASDAFHFATLWARSAVALGRRVHFEYGMRLYPNVYLVGFGPTADRKTTATRKVTEISGDFKIIHGAGSGEGLADEFSAARPGEGFLIYVEEFSQILRPGRWEGATLIPFLTQTFDCPPKFEMKFRKSPVALEKPTPSLLAGATPDWFWRDFRVSDFQGGFGNRLFFVTGGRKPAIPLPENPDLTGLAGEVEKLSAIEPCEARFEPAARDLWETFYFAWDSDRAKRDPLLSAATARIPAYVLKLGMGYAGLERTLPHITKDQLTAAILVGRFGEKCIAELLSLQNAGTNPTKELERRILDFVRFQPGRTTLKRQVYKALWRHYSTAEGFNRAFESLVRAGELFTAPMPRGAVLVSLEPSK